MAYISVQLDDFDTDDLIEKLSSRGIDVLVQEAEKELLEKIYNLKQQDKPYESELNQLLYKTLGRIA
jgi:hypothetical protein